ncbi:MAG: sensor histidine kinase [Alkalispirochaeta sp.]
MANALFAGVLSLSIAIQVSAAILAVFNVRYTPRKLPWMCIAPAIVLMAVRRIVTLIGMIATWETPRTVSWGAEFTALIISLLMFTGMLLLLRELRSITGAMSEQQEVFRESLHTSKNHFQSLASLLHTQAGFATSEGQRALATEIEQKVSAYAILQQQLFERDYEVDIQRYLEQLTATIEDAYAVPGQHSPVRTEFSSFPATPKETLYAGLVVSESLINAYKYAATGAGPVEIAVSAGPAIEGPGRRVEVRDSGPGFPQEVLSADRSGYGTTFLRSLNGSGWSITLANDGGAVVRAEF